MARASLQTALQLGRRLGADVVMYQAHLAEAQILEPDAPDEARELVPAGGGAPGAAACPARADDLKLAVVGQGESLYERIARLLLGPVTTYCETCAPTQARAVGTRAKSAFRWLERGKSRGLLEDTLAEQTHTPNPSPKLRQARERVGEPRGQLNAAYESKYALNVPSARGCSAAPPPSDQPRTWSAWSWI